MSFCHEFFKQKIELSRCASISRQADVVASLTLEVLKGTSRAFDSDVHAVRPHKGQKMVASRIRSLLHSETYPSEIARECIFKALQLELGHDPSLETCSSGAVHVVGERFFQNVCNYTAGQPKFCIINKQTPHGRWG